MYENMKIIIKKGMYFQVYVKRQAKQASIGRQTVVEAMVKKHKNEIHYKCVVRGKNYYIVRRFFVQFSI